MTKKFKLLEAFLKEPVTITLSLKSAIQMPDGDMLEAPLVLEGVVLDYDDDFILIGQRTTESLELISIKSVVGIKQIIDSEMVMGDPDKPPMENMN